MDAFNRELLRRNYPRVYERIVELTETVGEDAAIRQALNEHEERRKKAYEEWHEADKKYWLKNIFIITTATFLLTMVLLAISPMLK